MVRKIAIFVLIIMFSLIAAACGDGNENNASNQDEKLEPIQAALEVPEEGDKGEKVVFSTEVTHGEEKVEDASEVKYEVWKEGQKDKSEMIEAKHEKNGIYKAEKTFDEDGLYTVQVHVTARDMHTMPKAEIRIGETEAHGHSEESSHEHGQGHEESLVTIHLMKADIIKANQETEMKVHLEHEEKELEDAEVRLEIYKEGQEKHDWVDLTEAQTGEYETNYSFHETGTYNVKVHVTKGSGIHEHTMEKIEVES
jgi:hypothetical protein